MTHTQFASDQERSGSSQWIADLLSALHAGDDHALWQLVDRHHDPAEAHRDLATIAARMAYRIGEKPRFSEVFLLPVIEQPGTAVINEPSLWHEADHCIGEALDAWLAPKTRKTVFRGVRPYDWIGTWRPAVLQCHLHSTIPGSGLEKLNFLTEKIDLPPEAPKLGFVCMVLTCDRGWPQLPPINTLRDNRFKSVVSFALQRGKGGAAPTVLTPDRVQCAVPDGICLWLLHLNEALPIKGWMALPLQASSDVVKITVTFDHDTVPQTQFTLRKHQLGPAGLAEVLAMLAALAPTIDRPMDMPVKRETTTLHLT